MIELLATSYEFAPLAAAGVLGMIYLISLIVGGGLLVISTFLGGDADADADIDPGVDGDVDGDVPGDHAGIMSLSNWFSMRFCVYFAAAFGLVGTTLVSITNLLPAVVLTCAVLGGLVVGQGAHQVMRSLARTSGNSQVRREDYVDKPGRVTIAIAPPGRGEVAIQVKGRERFIPATAQRGDDRFDVGSKVVVVGFNNGTVEVVSEKEHEFVNQS